MFFNITNLTSGCLWCVTMVLLLRNLLTVNSATINNNSWLEKRLNFTCLQMDTWDCFSLNKGYFQKENKNINERADNVKVITNGTTKLVESNNTYKNSVDKLNTQNISVVDPYFFAKPTKHIEPGMDVQNKDVSSSYDFASPGHPRSSRTSRKLGQPIKDETDDSITDATVDEDRYMEMADSLWSSSFRTARISRKMWMAILAGIVLKFASLMPLILGKFALLGTVSILASKLSLLIVAIMAMRQLFTADVKGFGAFPDLGFGGHHHHHQAMGQYYGHQQQHHPQAMSHHGHGYQNYHPMMALSYANLHQAAPAAAQKKWV